MIDVAIVGGGIAGLGTALHLATRGFRVRVLERRPLFGGRAFSYRSPTAGHVVDNGQHLLMGCYAATLRLLDGAGARDRIEIQSRLELGLAEPGGRTSTLRCPALPSPFDLAWGLVGFGRIPVRERATLLAGALGLALGGTNGATVATALGRQGSSARAAFWDPLAIAALNEHPEQAAASLFREVVKRVLFAGSDAAKLVFPKDGLSAAFADPIVMRARELGAIVEEGRAVRRIVDDGGRLRGVELRDGEIVEARAVVAAVPPPALVSLLSDEALEAPPFRGLSKLEPSPIVSIHLWLANDVPTPRMLGFIEGPIHWLFTPPMQPERGRYVTLVTSAARDLVDLEPDELVAMALRELARHGIDLEGDLTDSLVTKEREATWAGTPREQALRFGPETPISGLAVAGDWTDTGLPATIESAAVSAENAAAYLAAFLE